MTPRQQRRILDALALAWSPRSVQRVSEWCESNVIFNEPNCRGPFSFAGREYLREPLDDWADSRLTDQIFVMGTRTGKTRIFMGGTAWIIAHSPSRILWVMPNTHGTGGAQNFSRTRWQPTIRSTESLSALIPRGGQSRHTFKALQQILGGSIVDFTGSNSPANLASNPARIVNQDEVDKYNLGGRREADASKLADERAKEFSDPKRTKASTPTLESGLIWQELQKTDIRRRFLPCPHCKKFIVLAWAKAFTVFPLMGCEAFVRWDNEAKKESGWDLDRVVASARYECPFCAGHIIDGMKSKMDRDGQWRPTKPGTPGYRGYHLPSMYSLSRETNVGQMAKRFLTSKNSLQGLQGFVNSDLAEPWMNQDSISERLEIISPPDSAPIEGAVKLVAFDYQLLSPHFWGVAAEFSPTKIKITNFDSFDSWDECKEHQKLLKIQDHHVGVDSGKFAEDVYEACLRKCKLVPRPGGIPTAVGWTPMKGFGQRQFWKDKKTGLMMPMQLSSAPLPHRKFKLPLLIFNGDMIKDIFSRLRRNKTKIVFEIANAAATDEFFKHLDAETRKPVFDPMSRKMIYKWTLRSKSWPNHGLDCVIMLLALALFHKLLIWSDEIEKVEEPAVI